MSDTCPSSSPGSGRKSGTRECVSRSAPRWMCGSGRFTDDGRLRVGMDFFIQALTTSSEGLRLQIDAADGWFGGHVASRWDFRDAAVTVRLRILHLSGHMVDGHFDKETDAWKDGREPIPFTRDFGELSAALSTSVSSVTIRGFAGTSYATLIRPETIERWEFLGGFDLHTASLIDRRGPVPPPSLCRLHVDTCRHSGVHRDEQRRGGSEVRRVGRQGDPRVRGVLRGTDDVHAVLRSQDRPLGHRVRIRALMLQDGPPDGFTGRRVPWLSVPRTS